MSNINQLSAEDYLIRRGNLLNPLGLFRAVRIHHGKLTKNDFIRIIRKNYLVNENDETPIDLIKKIDDVWNKSDDTFKKLELKAKITNDSIEIEDPMKDFHI